VDTFTAVNLLIFNKWSSEIQPKIPFSISRWIFAGCIIASFVLLAYRWFRAIRVMRTGSVAESYLDPLAVRVQSVRVGKSKGYRRFLVFAELTKSKKGADYVALFTYFSFECEFVVHPNLSVLFLTR
jgi:Fungal potassium channel